MQDHITRLCEDLIGVEDPEEVLPAAEQLQEAIHVQVERVRHEALSLVLIDRVIDLDGLIESQSQASSQQTHQHSG